MSTLLMLGASLVMLTLCFPPFSCFFLAPFALIPLCLCVLRRPMTLRYAGLYYLLGLVYFLINLVWLAPVIVPGYVILCAYLAIFVVTSLYLTHRLAVQCRIPVVLALPLAWTSVEFFRSSFIEGGFPWFILGNCLAPAPLLIQSADLFGVWGLTFMIALLNGAVVDLLRLPLMRDGKFNPVIGWIGTSALAVVAFVVAYGLVRLNQQTITRGPRVAVIQENIPQSLKDSGVAANDIFVKHAVLTTEAARSTPKPDLIVWPETMLPGFGNREFLEAPDAAFDKFVDDEGKPAGEMWRLFRQRSKEYVEMLQGIVDTWEVPVLVGAGGFDPRTDLNDSIKRNYTMLMMPKRGVVERYSKVHLVPFGEYLPWRDWPVVGKYMIYLSPMGYDYSNEAGKVWTRFVLRGADGREYTFGTPICFEDTMPEPARKMSAPQFDATGRGRKADFLVNVSNDGWFYWVELDQRLQASQLRAVENRVAIARSVNTGDSGFVDTRGRVVKLVTDRQGNSIHAVGWAALEMPLDSRVTLYSRIGDLFPIVCSVSTVLLVGWTFVRPRRG